MKHRYKYHLFICTGKSCSELGDPNAAKAFFKGKIKSLGLKDQIRACTSSCLDLCGQGPNMVIYPEETWYSGLQDQRDYEEIWNSIVQELSAASGEKK